MATLIALLVLLPLLFAAWRAWKRTMRDYVRDYLFALRDEWRARWIAGGLDMRTPAYAEVRDHINASLRYTSQFRMVELVYYARHLRHVPPAMLEVHLTKTGRPDLDTLAIYLCHRTVRLLQLYMLMTSLLLVPTCCLALWCIVVERTFQPMVAARKAARRAVDKCAFTSRPTIEAALRFA